MEAEGRELVECERCGIGDSIVQVPDSQVQIHEDNQERALQVISGNRIKEVTGTGIKKNRA